MYVGAAALTRGRARASKVLLNFARQFRQDGQELTWPRPPPQKRTKRPPHRFAKDQLKALIERIERLEEEKKTISDDIRDVYAEAKAIGFDVKALRTIVRLRKQDADERKEQEAVLETYMHALGMLN